MQYFGGKYSVGKQIASICMTRLGPGSQFVEMCCGSLNIIRHIPSHISRTAIDACAPLITMWKHALSGWIPPKVVSREMYDHYKQIRDPNDPMTAFVLFGCSFGGKWCGGYAKDRADHRYAECASNAVVRKARDCLGMHLESRSFLEFCPGGWPPGTVLYCDPPYEGTTGYGYVGRFDNEAFWLWASQHADRGVHVFVSEGEHCATRDGWELIGAQAAAQGGQLTPTRLPRVDKLFYKGP